MKKIGLNEHYGLQTAVYNGTKTKTRRIEKCLDKLYAAEKELGEPLEIYQQEITREGIMLRTNAGILSLHTRYKIDEEVAVAQAYKDIAENAYFMSQCAANEESVSGMKYEKGWNNKMYVAAYYMPHQIRITGIKVERLQDISENDALKEGIYFYNCGIDCGFTVQGLGQKYGTAKAAFADLIDRRGIGGPGTWERNPWVVVYSFKLIK